MQLFKIIQKALLVCLCSANLYGPPKTHPKEKRKLNSVQLSSFPKGGKSKGIQKKMVNLVPSTHILSRQVFSLHIDTPQKLQAIAANVLKTKKDANVACIIGFKRRQAIKKLVPSILAKQTGSGVDSCTFMLPKDDPQVEIITKSLKKVKRNHFEETNNGLTRIVTLIDSKKEAKPITDIISRVNCTALHVIHIEEEFLTDSPDCKYALQDEKIS